jgi:hypothetical protein
MTVVALTKPSLGFLVRAVIRERNGRLEVCKVPRRGAGNHQGAITMSRIRTLTTAAVAAVALAVAASPASATLHSPTDSYTATPCKLDTSPSYPSCGTSPAAVDLVHGTSFTATPCKLDTSPSYPSCGTSPAAVDLVHGTSFTATPCKLDTSPNYPSCGTDLR